jgi:ABC-type glutathione transport system ATPase component
MISARELVKSFNGRAAVDGVSLEVQKGETLAIVGRTGSGKSTLARMLVRLVRPDRGRVFFDATDITELDTRALAPIRKRMQIVFQDPGTALDPRLRVEAILREPLEIHGLDGPEPASMLPKVGLDANLLSRFPNQLSGGQKQRVAIARALALSPEVLVLDEPLSALDTDAQQETIALLQKLRQERSLTYVMISHDLRAVRAFASRVAVMFRGRVVEDKPVSLLFSSPEHKEAQALVMAAEAVR